MLRDRLPRPMSANISTRPLSATTKLCSRLEVLNADHDSSDIESLVQEDDEDDEDNLNNSFEDEAFAAQRLLMAQTQSGASSVKNGKRFRPTSAPVHRSRPHTGRNSLAALKHHEPDHERAAISLGYLKQAAEKRKKREADFARDLLREENEYKRKTTQKIEQANRMAAALGTSRTFSMAPDRDGLHTVQVSDPACNERVISIENFLREFERLASVQIGQVQRGKSTSLKGTSQDLVSSRSSKLRVHGIKTSRLGSFASLADLNALSASAERPVLSNSKRPQTKSTDRALIQEELKSILVSTIDLTKVLQDQLHELKLKGWNFSSRATTSSGA